MGNRERDEQMQQENERQEQERQRQEQERMNAPRAILGNGDDETSTSPVIVNH